MEISRARGAILAESTDETKTTTAFCPPRVIMSNNANLLDMIEKHIARRYVRNFLVESAALM